jgi:hypothetical protein
MPFKKTHGLSKTSIYNIYRHINRRCYDPSTPFYKDYGGRGIVMCPEWRNSFEAFYADMGDRPSTKHSIDRKNNDGNYEPSNCRWVTDDIQAQNSRAAKLNSSAVAVIRHMHRTGTSVRRLADAHGVCKNTIGNVVSRRTWSNYA